MIHDFEGDSTITKKKKKGSLQLSIPRLNESQR